MNLKIPQPQTYLGKEVGEDTASVSLIEQVNNFYVGDIITSLKLATTVTGGEVIIASTLTGSIRAFVPVKSRKRLRILTNLERKLSETFPNVLHRDYFSYRSTILPSQAIIDGELCGMFSDLSDSLRDSLSESIGVKTVEISRLLDDMKSQLT